MNGRDLYDLRNRINLSELARRSGVAVNTVHTWKGRPTDIPADLAKALAGEMLKLAADLVKIAGKKSPAVERERTGRPAQRRI